MATCPIDCACHASPFAACSVPGGCGSHGCRQTDDCAVCQKRPRDTGQVCDPCRRWLPVALASIPDLADRLHDELVPDDDSTTNPVLVCIGCGLTGAAAYHPSRPEYDDPNGDRWHGGFTRRRIVRRAAGPAPSIAPDIIVTGGADEAPVPIDLHIHDLLGPVIRDGGRPIDTTGDNWIRASSLIPVTVGHIWFEVVDRREETLNEDGTTTVTLHRDFRHVREQLTVMDRRTRLDANGRKVMVPAGDQIGEVPVAQVLDQEMRAWIDAGAPGGRFRPTPTIPHLVDWLAKRLDWACDHYPGIDVFAAAVQRVRGQMAGALGDFDPQAEQCEGVPCDRCDLRMLFRRQDGTGDVECQNPDCLKVFTADQYRELVAYEAAEERSSRGREEVAELMRLRPRRTADLRPV